MLHPLCPADDTRRTAELPALDNLLRRRGKVPDLARQRLFHNVSVERDRQLVVVAGRKVERARVLLAQIELHIPRRRVGDQVVARGVIHAPLAAVVDLEAAGRMRALHGAERGVYVVISDFDARENRVDRLHHFPIGIIEMIDRVLRILMQHRRLRIR